MVAALKNITWSKDVTQLNIKRNDVAFWLLAVMMIYLPIRELIDELVFLPCSTQSYMVGLYGAVAAIFAVVVLVKDIRQRKIYPYEIFYILLIVFAVISLIFAVDGTRPLWEYNYQELPIHFLAYYSLMFMAVQVTETKSRLKLLKVFVIVALIQCTVAFLQTFGIQISFCYYDAAWHTKDRICYGLTQHNNFFAGLSILFTAVSTGLFVFFCKSLRSSAAILGGYMLFLYCSLCTGARIAWVGNICLLLFYVISILIMKHRKYDSAGLKAIAVRFGIILLVTVILTVCLLLFTNYLSGGISDFQRESESDEITALASNRFKIWKYGLMTVPTHWLTGLGLDHYGYAFFLNPEWELGMWYQDKGHNEYIHILVTEGVFAFANYVALLVYAARRGIKSVLNTQNEARRYVAWIITGMFVGYGAQAFFNSSVINIVLYFWIVIGLMMPVTEQKPFTLGKKQKA